VQREDGTTAWERSEERKKKEKEEKKENGGTHILEEGLEGLQEWRLRGNLEGHAK
jgi:hypothetical protein